MGATAAHANRMIVVLAASVIAVLTLGMMATRVADEQARRRESAPFAAGEFDDTGSSILGGRQGRQSFRYASSVQGIPPESDVAGAVEVGRSFGPSTGAPATKCDTKRLTVIALSQCTAANGTSNVLIDVAGAVNLSATPPETPEVEETVDEVEENAEPTTEVAPSDAPAQRNEPTAHLAVNDEAVVLLDAEQPLLRTTGGLTP